MRQLGTIPQERDARLFADHLEGLGMTTRVEPEGDAWAVWVYHEDHVPKAREEFAAFQKDPTAPRFKEAPRAAERIRKERKELDRQYRKNVKNFKGRWDGINYRGRPLTMTLVAICILVFIGESSPWGGYVIDRLLLTSVTSIVRHEPGMHQAHQLRDVASGQVWRLVTPIFLHFGIFHIVFNMWALISFGSIIEYCRGTRNLLILVLISAVSSNMLQYMFMVNFYDFPRPFGGMSGVVYALFGYVWMKSLYEPEQGMVLHRRSVQYMIFWLVLCMAMQGLVPVANAAHVGGLIVGILYGLARF